MACLNSKILPSKINFLLNFFGHLMTSEVKDHVYKVEDYLVMISEVFLCKKISKLRVQMACLNSKNLPSKVNFLTIFFGHLMTSEVKGHFYKVEDNLVNYMHKNFRNDIWTGLCVRRFQSYEFKWHVLTAKIFRQRSIFQQFFSAIQ